MRASSIKAAAYRREERGGGARAPSFSSRKEAKKKKRKRPMKWIPSIPKFPYPPFPSLFFSLSTLFLRRKGGKPGILSRTKGGETLTHLRFCHRYGFWCLGPPTTSNVFMNVRSKLPSLWNCLSLLRSRMPWRLFFSLLTQYCMI